MSSTIAPGEGIAGICSVRDAIDLIPFTCGHYLHLGFDRLHFIDDGSTDGTSDFLAKLSRRDKRVTILRLEASAYTQRSSMNEAIAQVLSDGFRIIFPFDVDEFWNIRLDSIRACAAGRPAGVFNGHWVQFVQSNAAEPARRLYLLAARYRAPVLGTAKQVRDASMPFVCHSETKIGFKSDGPVTVNLGQHRLEDGPEAILASGLEVFHLPLRSFGALQIRAQQSKRRALPEASNAQWQSKMFRDSAETGTLADIWADNSADRQGCIAVGGTPMPLVPDGRLRLLLLRAWFYMLRRHAILLLGSGSGREA